MDEIYLPGLFVSINPPLLLLLTHSNVFDKSKRMYWHEVPKKALLSIDSLHPYPPSVVKTRFAGEIRTL